MKISLDDIKRLQSDQPDVSVDLPMKEPKAKKIKEPKVKGRFSEFISKTVMIEDDDSEDIVVAADETVDPEVTKLAWVKWTLMVLAYLGAIAVATLVIMGFLNTPNVGLTDGITPQAVTNDDHYIILSGSYGDFDTLVGIYGGGQTLESDDIVVDAPEVSDEAYEKRIENLQEEIRQLKEQLAQVSEGSEASEEIRQLKEQLGQASEKISQLQGQLDQASEGESVSSIDMTNAEIARLKAALTASEAREKLLREAQTTP